MIYMYIKNAHEFDFKLQASSEVIVSTNKTDRRKL